jgi:hypothetical protein
MTKALDRMSLAKIKKWSSILLCTVVATCCLVFVVRTIEAADSRHHLETLLVDVNVGDGIDAREADAIAWAYFLGFVSACGGPDQGTLVNGEWVIPAAFGYAGTPMDSPIRVNARTGAVSQAGGPSFNGYRSFRFSVLWGIPIRALASRPIDD